VGGVSFRQMYAAESKKTPKNAGSMT
jgi:hypothetical protein